MSLRKNKNRHFLSHTLEHLLGVSVVLAIALTLGHIGKNLNISDRDLLAQTSASTSSTTDPYATSATQVFFSAERVLIGCANNITTAKYHFSIMPQSGGSIILSTPDGPTTINAQNGAGWDRYLPTGSYTWTGNAYSGYTGSNYGVISVENVCTTTSTTTTATTPPPPPPSTETTLVLVSFGASPGPTPRCEGGQPLTPVFLAITKPFGGGFKITSNTGMLNAQFEWGEHYFPNGRYAWSAYVKPGYQGEGPLAGEFVIQATCPTVTTATTPTTTITTTTYVPPVTAVTPTTTSITIQPVLVSPTATQINPALPPLPRPLLSMFINNIPVTIGRVFNKEQVELRVTTAVAESVTIVTMNGIDPARTHGEAVPDDLLSRPGIDVWVYTLPMANFPEGKIKIQARVKHTDSRETQTEPLTISVSHPALQVTGAQSSIVPTASSGTLQTSVRVSEADKAQILARISDPSSCTNAEECQIYCRSVPGVNDLCMAYARETVVDEPIKHISLVGDMSDAELMGILSKQGEHQKDLPAEVTAPNDLREYCATAGNFGVCANLLMQDDSTLDLPTLTAIRDEIEIARKTELLVLTERTGTRAHYDTDQDGVTDYDEVNIYKTDPSKIDSDDDGFGDGAELLARTNPLGGSIETKASSTVSGTSDESLAFYNPMISGVAEKTLLSVNTVEVTEIGQNAEGSATAKKIKMTGKAQANSFVTIYIFSEPIIVTVKADATGAWVYTLDKELADGTHQIYSAITDAGGRILAKSDPLPFVKVASAVSFGAESPIEALEKPGFFSGASLYAMIAMLIGILGVALSIIGFIVRQKNENEAGLPGI